MYQSTKKRANGPKCPVTGKRIQGVCDFLFLNFYSFLVEFGIYLPSTFIYRCDLVLVLGFVELILVEMVVIGLIFANCSTHIIKM